MRRSPRKVRRGAVLVEGLIVMLVFLVLILGMVDVGTAVLHHNILSAAARSGMREIIAHGSLAPPRTGTWSGPWGPGSSYPGSNPYTVTADKASDPIANTFQPYLTGLDAGTVNITVTWLDGDNNPGSSVMVTLTATYEPATILFYAPLVTQTASTTMPIAH